MSRLPAPMSPRDRLLSCLADDDAAVLPLVAMLMVVLIGMAAFATDLGWFYANASRVERAAEAAALSGVVELPLSPATASTVALTVADNNGYTDGGNATVTPVPQPGGEDTQMQVTISTEIDTFFLSVFGIESQTITRTAFAEYLPPLPLGSPNNQFGNSCDPREAGCSGQPNFWANIHGRETGSAWGDAYSSYCDANGNSEGCSPSPSYRTQHGYLYGIEAQNVGGSFTVSFNDLAHRYDPLDLPVAPTDPSCVGTDGTLVTDDDCRTGDTGCQLSWGSPNDPNCGMHMRVTMYGPDQTPLDPSNNPVLCTSGVIPPEAQVESSVAYTWDTIPGCNTVAVTTAGVYLVEVEVVDVAGDIDDGLNRYAIRATGSANPRLFGVGDFSLYNNATATQSEFFLAEIGSFYRGRQLVVELFDPGDANPGGTVQLLRPSGPASWSVVPACELLTRDEVTGSWVSQGIQTPCDFFADNAFNDRWVQLKVTLPDTYSCMLNCWWQINYNFSNEVNDTTTWRAEIVGAPVHLLP